MRTVKTQDLTPGMITAEPVLSKHGQLIVAADTELTNQMIAHLSYYNIPSASILDGTIPPAAIASMQKTEQVTLSYSQKIRSSRSFQRFKSDYVKKIRFLKSSLNDLIDRTDPIDQAELLPNPLACLANSQLRSLFLTIYIICVRLMTLPMPTV